MSGISYVNKDYIYSCITKAKKSNASYIVINGGPCACKLIQDLKKDAYTVEEFSDFEIISWSK